MSELPHQPNEPAVADTPLQRTNPKRWQVGIRTLVLLMAAIAVWITYAINRRENATLEARIVALRPLARELVIEDPDKIAVVKLEEYWYDENVWDVYLPEGTFRLCLATTKIDQKGFAQPAKAIAIPAGRHRITLDQTLDGDNHRVTVTLNHEKRLEAVEPKGWDPGQGSSGGGQHSTSAQFPASEPVELFRRRFLEPRSKGGATEPNGPCNGILVWIERADSL